MSIKQNFGKKLRQLRQKRGINQEKLSELIGIQPENYSRIENGLSFPKPENIEKIATVLSIEVSELFEFANFLDIDKIKTRLISKIETDNDTARIAYEFLKNIGRI